MDKTTFLNTGFHSDFLEYCSRGEQSFDHFHMFVFLEAHFTAFGLLEHVTNAVSVCIAQTQSLSCVLFTFCIMSLNFHWPKKWYDLFTSCSVLCMQAWRSETTKSEPVYPLFVIISSECKQQRIWKKLTYCRVLFYAVRMFTRHTLDVQPPVLNCECSSQTASSDEFQPISSCPLPVVG